MNQHERTDPSPQPSPLRKGRRGIVGSAFTVDGSWKEGRGVRAMGEPGESRREGERSVRRFRHNWPRLFLVEVFMRTTGLGLCRFLLAVWESIEFILHSLEGSGLIKGLKESTCSNHS